ncbi:MAG TPA: XTP/dITP diphosphatase [Dissulfurispiraceae bacterium]|nr:XTP/dITP diphosphatase [Dissulfurispiraceae bacterium]
MEIVLASRNRKKAEEIQRILAGQSIEVRSLADFPDCPDVVEDADTFDGNALKKAREVAAFTGRIAIADDSGIEVAALNGAPGVHSARYAGSDATDAANVEKLLFELRNVPDGQRAARFVCCIALAVPGQEAHTFWGFVDGAVGKERKGTSGFGYDPIFYPAGHDLTFAEITASEKDDLSHRRKALGKLAVFLELMV